ncbi:MAG: cytochrome c, partial [Bacteroidetes bacterium]|nr:cytochrome c [Bacteroidota bacterium]
MRYRILGLILTLIAQFFTVSIFTQNQPPPEFATCTACHTIGKGKLIGPDLKGVNDRHNEAWLLSFIRSSQTMIKNGDPVAVKL